MDKREARESLGTNHHFNPSKNPQISPPASKANQNWFGIPGNQMRIRQNSLSSDTSSPVGSPTEAVDFTKLERRNSKTLYASFGFNN